MKTIKEKLNYLLGRQDKEEITMQDDRTIQPTEKREDTVIYPDPEPISPPPLFSQESFSTVEEVPEAIPSLDHLATKTNDDLRTVRKKAYFVSGEDYDALERELNAKTKECEEFKRKLEEIKKIV